jgi:flagellar secretion chaperone FliS
MQSSAHENYLVTHVMTATPQKLQLMLIEAAIRSAERARQKWQSNDDEQACEALIRAQEIVSELLASLDRETSPELVKKVAAVYLFVFRSLVEANTGHDEQKLGDAIRVLEIERQTWREVCEKLGSSASSGAEYLAGAEARQPAVPSGPHALPNVDLAGDLPAGGFSLEA